MIVTQTKEKKIIFTKKIDEMLKCGICWENFNFLSRKCKLLKGCSHYGCQQCLQFHLSKNTTNNRELICPFCRAVTMLDISKGVSGLHANNAISELIDIHQDITESLKKVDIKAFTSQIDILEYLFQQLTKVDIMEYISKQKLQIKSDHLNSFIKSDGEPAKKKFRPGLEPTFLWSKELDSLIKRLMVMLNMFSQGFVDPLEILRELNANTLEYGCTGIERQDVNNEWLVITIEDMIDTLAAMIGNVTQHANEFRQQKCGGGGAALEAEEAHAFRIPAGGGRHGEILEVEE